LEEQRIGSVSKDVIINTNPWFLKLTVKSQKITKHEIALVRCEGKTDLKRYDM
jgi:hypothetical protein